MQSNAMDLTNKIVQDQGKDFNQKLEHLSSKELVSLAFYFTIPRVNMTFFIATSNANRFDFVICNISKTIHDD